MNPKPKPHKIVPVFLLGKQKEEEHPPRSGTMGEQARVNGVDFSIIPRDQWLKENNLEEDEEDV